MDAVFALSRVALFSSLTPSQLAGLASHARPVQLASGACLYQAGSPSDTFYVLVRGRLRVSAGDDLLGYVNRHEPVGEMGVVSGDPRSSNVHAVRDCLLLAIPAENFLAFMHVQSDAMIELTRLVIARGREYRTRHRHSTLSKGGTMALIPAAPGVSAIQLGEALVRHLQGWPHTTLITAAHVDTVFGAGFAQTPLDGGNADLRLRHWLAELEERHVFVLYAADNDHDPWSLRCLRQADRILVLGEAASPPDDVPVLDQLRKGGLLAPVELVLLRPEGDPSPYTRAWLKDTGARAHYFVHPWAHADVCALARQISGRGIGLVLGGGGARGFAHIGLLRAFEQLQIPVDIAGGTSMGAFVSAMLSCGFDSVEMEHIAHETFVARNYLNDYTMPRVSLIRGQRFHNRLQAVFGNRQIEELRRSYYCITTNLTTGMPMVHDNGGLATWVGSSMSVPGVAPPVAYEGDLLCDGAVVNNLPTDVMQSLERGVIIASNVSATGEIRAPGAGIGEPDQQALLKWRGQQRAPKLSEILMRSASLASETSIQQASIERADICLHLPVQDIGMFDWPRLSELIERGYQHAMEQLTPLRETLPD